MAFFGQEIENWDFWVALYCEKDEIFVIKCTKNTKKDDNLFEILFLADIVALHRNGQYEIENKQELAGEHDYVGY